jgi:hypothetical protein
MAGPWSRCAARCKTDLNKGVAVKGGINVYITYFTTFPRPASGGRMLLSPGRDVYGLDAANARTLAAFIPWQEAPAAAGHSPVGWSMKLTLSPGNSATQRPASAFTPKVSVA